MNKYMPIVIFVLLLSLCPSCTIYRENFDCPPCPGVPCTSVTDLEAMIIETPEGPDVFTGERPEKLFPYRASRVAKRCYLKKRKRLWVCDQITQEGTFIQGHYIYFNDLDEKFQGCPDYAQSEGF